MPNILALDPALHCGFAFSSGASGVWDISRLPHASMYKTLSAFSWPIDIIATEQASLGSHHIRTQQFHARLLGVIECYAEGCGIPVVLVNPASLKAWATGNGRAKKDQMMAAAKTQFGKTFRDDNECDAWWVLKYVEAEQHLKTPKAIEKRLKATRKKDPRLF